MDVVHSIKTCCDVAVAIFYGVYGWVTEALALVFLILLFNFISKWVLKALHLRFEKQDKIWNDAFVRALHKPLSYFVWYFAGVQAINLISFRMYQTCTVENSHLLTYVGLIAAAAWFFMRWKHNITESLVMRAKANRIHMERGKIDVIDKLLTMLILFLTFLFLLDATGMSMNTVIAFGGVGGLAIAFASQEIISSFFGGLMVYITHPFSIGDWVQLPEKEIEGHVEEIGWYMTRIRTFEKRPLYVPNSFFTKIVIITPSRMSHRRIKEFFGIRYEDLSKIKGIIDDIKKMIENHFEIDNSQLIIVNFFEYGEYSLKIQLICYTLSLDSKGFFAVKQDILLKIWEIITKNGAEVAYPTYLYLENKLKPQTDPLV